MSVTVIVGTAKGGFVLRSDDRRSWQIEGPFFKGWKVTTVARADDGTFLIGAASDVYGAAIHKSKDLSDWRQVAQGPAYSEDEKRQLTQIWKLVVQDGAYYAGVAEAGLFRSEDRGETWQPMPGLNDHRSRSAWMPGAGGLCAHSILIDPANPKRLWCGISAVGVFRSDDGGDTWHPKNNGVPVILEDKEFSEIGFCVHALAQDPDNADLIYRQDHRGMFRTKDGGDHWERIENGLPSGFGFPLVLDRETRALYAAPLESDEFRLPCDGKFQIFRSRNGGDAWEPLTNGLPQEHAYAGVLRGAMDADHLAPCGVYVGTTSGDVFVSSDGGDRWNALPYRLPRVHCVAAYVEG
ncbi:MAG: hypothetical protein MI923_18735 [Phycisphaerales bacterium]|nr:hypothetical protein [Phycisphaerales bacterium]